MGVSTLLSLTAIVILFAQRLCAAFHLHDGCLIRESYTIKTFEDSISFLMLFPPKNGFFLRVAQDSPAHTFPVSARGLEGPQRWMQMELLFSDSVELRFENGTTWVKESSTLEGQLLKSVSMSLGLWALNCPQRMPFWTLKEKAATLSRDLWVNQNVTFSLVSTVGSLVYLSLERENLLLCWDAVTDQLVVGLVISVVESCQPLPALKTIWLRFEFKEGLVTTARITGEVYVVEHVDGYPEPHRVLPLQQEEASVVQDKTGRVWVWACVAAVALLFLMLLAAVGSSFVFYSRWRKAKEVLLLLRKGADEEDAKEARTPPHQQGQPLHPRPWCPSPPLSPRPPYRRPCQVTGGYIPDPEYVQDTGRVRARVRGGGRRREVVVPEGGARESKQGF
ncbi:hypothetical protein C7M84_012318 [Penaeus vannamei]|uniref:Uncharacterized protein n=1 Tax=Penaeus vannamei TaxID=6689 RepID=A0A423SZ94_PENVA|nr:hypothetical protein C7M84_012318 [Penaeus vannamei]